MRSVLVLIAMSLVLTSCAKKAQDDRGVTLSRMQFNARKRFPLWNGLPSV